MRNFYVYSGIVLCFFQQPVMKFAELASEVQVQRAPYSGRHELGLPSGRRRANQLFREAQRRAEEETVVSVKVSFFFFLITVSVSVLSFFFFL